VGFALRMLDCSNCGYVDICSFVEDKRV
jgi:hypothetical protein